MQQTIPCGQRLVLRTPWRAHSAGMTLERSPMRPGKTLGG